MSLELREWRNIVANNRMQATGWRMEVTRAGRSAFWYGVSRNSDCLRRRRLCELAMAEVVDGGPVRTEGGEISGEPSDDELVPTAAKEDSAAHSSCPFRDRAGMEGAMASAAIFQLTRLPLRGWDRLLMPPRRNIEGL